MKSTFDQPAANVFFTSRTRAVSGDQGVGIERLVWVA